ncbi:MAG: hypothetical protein AABN95_16195 [Acidobacteriota bacterium]
MKNSNETPAQSSGGLGLAEQSTGLDATERLSTVRCDMWTTFPNIHLRVLDAEKGGIEIQICDCGMSGHCRPQAWARIEKHNRNTLANALKLPARPGAANATSK